MSKTVFADQIPMPVYLGDHTDVVGKLHDVGVIVDMPNAKRLLVHSDRQDIADRVEEIFLMELPKGAVSTRHGIGQGRYGVSVDSQAVSLQGFISALEVVHNHLVK